MARRDQVVRRNQPIWKRFMHALTCQNRLFGKFALFIIALFMFYYILYVSLLPPFTKEWFTNRTFDSIGGEYVT